MTINETLLKGKQVLESAYNPDPWLDAELLLAHLLNVPRTHLTAHSHQQLDRVTAQQYNSVMARRCRGEPVAYITGEKEFCGLTFKVTADVLIPRPATEELVETVIKEQKTIINDQLSLIDVGTGSGCIAISLAKHIPNSHIIATDISQRALTVARENAQCHGVADRITFLHGDLLGPLLCHPALDAGSRNKNKKNTGRFFSFLDSRLRGVVKQSSTTPLRGNDGEWILTANLPYVPTLTLTTKPELQFEPHEALDGGPDGALFYRRFLKQLLMINDRFIPTLIALEIEDDAYHALTAFPMWASLQSHYRLTRNSAVLLLTQN